MTFRKKRTKRFVAALLGALVALGSALPAMLVVPARVAAQSGSGVVVASYDFENGQTQWWFGRGSSQVASVTEAAYSGNSSLKSTGRTSDWHGPAVDLKPLLQKNAVYEISAYVKRVQADALSTIKLTMQNIRPGAAQDDPQNWTQIDAKTISTTEWTLLSGTYSFADDMNELQLYVESSDATESFYVDNVVVRIVSLPPEGLEYRFENGQTQGWFGRDSSQVASVTEAAYGGNSSLKSTGRTSDWHGPAVDLKPLLQKNAVYEISAYVKRVQADALSTIKLTMQNIRPGAAQDDPQNWTQIDAKTISTTEWTLLSGTYSFADDMNELQLYVESSDATESFYIDNVVIRPLQSPGSGDQDQSGIRSDFEDGTAQGWQPRIGREQVTVTTEDKHGGTYALKVTGRQQPYDGAKINVLGKMHPGSTYTISVWVKLVPGEQPAQMRVSLERTSGGSTQYITVVPNTTVTADQWVRLTNQYTLTGTADQLFLYVESNSGTPSFYIDDFELTYNAPLPQLPIQTDIPSLKDVFAGQFDIGAAVEPSQFDSPLHVQLLTKHFNSLVAENVMKPESLAPREGQYNWANADRIVQFAREHGMKLRFHTLVWHQQTPDWFFKDANGNDMTPTPENKRLLLQRLENYIRAVVGRYKNDAESWDVVNEVIDPNQPDGMRRSKWYEITGLDYIRVAFRVTREVAGPNAKLFINDYNTHDPKKREFLYNLVTQLRSEGVPIDGVGHQTHINIESPSIELIKQSIERFAAIGLDNQITELDVSVYTNDQQSYSTVPDSVLMTQAYRYQDLFDAFRQLSDKISNVTFWGIADDHSWLHNRPIPRTDAPFLFDRQLQAKPAYWGVVDPSRLPVRKRVWNAPGATVAVDGQIDWVWNAVPAVSIGSTSGGLGATARALWDDRNLYLLVEVRDATAQPGDRVDVFLAPPNGGTPVKVTLARNGAPAGSNTVYSVMETGSGWRAEAAIPWDRSVEASNQIGFDLRVTDGANPGSPVSWNDPNHDQEAGTTEYGWLTLKPQVRTVEARYGTPTIDGVKDGVWNDATPIETGVWVMGTSGSTATARLLWDDQWLYVYAEVRDRLLSKASANPWEQDSVEIFLDQNNGKTSYYEEDDGQFRVNYDNEQSFGGYASADKFRSATRIVPGVGYVVEAAVRLDAITPTNGTIIGFDFQVNNDEDGDGVRDSVAIWNDPSGRSYMDVSGLGVVRLISKPGTVPSAPVFPISAPAPNTGREIGPDGRERVRLTVDRDALNRLLADAEARQSGSVELTAEWNDRTASVQVVLQAQALADAATKAPASALAFATDRAQYRVPLRLLDASAWAKSVGVSTENVRVVVEMSAPSPDAAKAVEEAAKRRGGQTAGGLLAFDIRFETNDGRIGRPDFGATFVERSIIVDGRLDPKTHTAVAYDETNGNLYFVPAEFRYDERRNRTEVVIRRNGNSVYAVVRTGGAPVWTDVSGHWAESTINRLAAKWLIDGVADDAFAPDRPVTRAEFAAMLTRALGLRPDAGSSDTATFRDVPSGAWYADAVRAATFFRLVEGVGDGRFRPEEPITREQTAVMLMRAYHLAHHGEPALPHQADTFPLERFADKVDFSAWSAAFAADAVRLGLMQGIEDRKFAPKDAVTRAQAAAVIERLLDALNWMS